MLMEMTIHPLAPLTQAEFERARAAIVELHGGDIHLFFRCIFLREPIKPQLTPFLELEHTGKLTDETPRPPRQAVVQYDVIDAGSKVSRYTTSIINLETGEEVTRETASQKQQTSYSPEEFDAFQDACVQSQMFKDAMAEFAIPPNFAITIDPWPYGGPDDDEDVRRLMQGLVFARDISSGSVESNHYAYPIPIIPVMDFFTREIIRIDRLATGGADDGIEPAARAEQPKPLFQNAVGAEYVPELLNISPRSDLKPINITQPEGASFKVHPDNLVEWQKWRFRLGFTPREGAVIHDLCYEDRPIIYRLSYSELTVPYGDPRPPFQRKQAFDLGDGGFGRVANNLELGCDCLGAIHYFDALLADPSGKPTLAKSVVCLHEQDNGIGWKHTNFRTDRAVVTRLRELVIQCVVTLANYEYVFAYKLDTAGGITVETRATGIMSVVAIDEGKTSEYGAVVAPGILAQNHQHIFAVRIDPAIDSYADDGTVIAVEESVPVPSHPKTNPYGNFYAVQKRPVEKACWIDAEPKLNRTIRLENATKKNPVSGRPVAYKLTPPSSQTLLAAHDSPHARRAKFAQHHVWVTGYRDGELWAAGEFTNQSTDEVGGVYDMVAREDWFVGQEGSPTNEKGGTRSSPVIWSVFGLTHNPRVEDWPVMPVEIHHMNFRPADFFTSNPALDVPALKNHSSVVVECCGGETQQQSQMTDAPVQDNPVVHRQGPGPDIAAADVGVTVQQQ